MKVSEVPQDDNAGYEAEKRAVYATDEQGRYTVATSTGWEAEDVVNSLAVEEFCRLANAARERALRGETSPLEFHMYERRMDVPTLAQATGIWQWRLQRHLRPDVFTGLSSKLLERYAEALGLTVAQLRRPEAVVGP